MSLFFPTSGSQTLSSSPPKNICPSGNYDACANGAFGVGAPSNTRWWGQREPLKRKQQVRRVPPHHLDLPFYLVLIWNRASNTANHEAIPIIAGLYGRYENVRPPPCKHEAFLNPIQADGLLRIKVRCQEERNSFSCGSKPLDRYTLEKSHHIAWVSWVIPLQIWRRLKWWDWSVCCVVLLTLLLSPESAAI